MLGSAALVFLVILVVTIITTSAFIKAYISETTESEPQTTPAHKTIPAEQPAPPPKQETLKPKQTAPSSKQPTPELKQPAPPIKPPTPKPREGLARTKKEFWHSLGGLFKRQTKIDDTLLEELHEVLYRADVGSQTVDLLVDKCRAKLHGKEAGAEQLLAIMREESSAIMEAAVTEETCKEKTIVLVVGINGVGKTTTIGKLGHYFQHEHGKSVLLCAADTFRAAAIDQLQIWANRLKTSLIKRAAGSDAGAVVYDAIQAAKKQNTDLLLVDTAGRLHNKDDLMAELQKIKKIASKNASEYGLETWIVLDATTGQNAIRQVEAFLALVKITGIVITKLDGTAKGGIIIGICDRFKIPLHFVGIGEQASDLQRFQPRAIAKQMF